MKTIPSKTIVSGYREGDSWFGVNYNMNIYRGCSHGCIYCDSRSECYRISDFDEVSIKENALAIIERDLCSKRRKGVVVTGAMSDPYNSFEEELRLTRGALELINKYRFGAAVATKSTLIARDIDILSEIRRHSPVLAKITVTASSDELSKLVEPNAPPSSERFRAAGELAEAGIPVCILMMPILPFIEDYVENIIEIVRKAAESGVKYISPSMGVTLRGNQKLWYFTELDRRFPGIRREYDKLYPPDAYSHYSPRKDELFKVFTEECDSLGIKYKMADIIADYQNGYYEENQISFL